MKVRIYLFIIIFLFSIFHQALASDLLNIKRNNLVLLNLNNTKLRNLIQKGDLRIKLIGNKDLKLLNIASKKHIVMFWKKLMWFWSKKLNKNLKISLLKIKRGIK